MLNNDPHQKTVILHRFQRRLGDAPRSEEDGKPSSQTLCSIVVVCRGISGQISMLFSSNISCSLVS
jgi:hypothetical protein